MKSRMNSLATRVARLPHGWTLVACAAVMVVAVGLRVAPLRAGLPYTDYIDEGYAMSQVMDHLNTQSIHCRWYGYPTVTSYLIASAAELAAPIYRAVHGRGLRGDIPNDAQRYLPLGLDYNLVAPPELIIVGRAVIVIASLLTVVLAWRLGLLIGGRTTGVIAMLLTAVCPALVTRSSNVIVDTMATLFALLALFLAERMRQRFTGAALPWRDVALAGIAAGLALSSKYTVGAVFVAVAVSIALAPAAFSRKLQALAIAGVCAAAAALAANPAFILHPEIIRHDMSQTSTLYGMLRSSPGYLGAAIAAKEVGLPLVSAGLGGLVLMLVARPTRVTAVAWLAFAIVLLIPLVRLNFQPLRNLLPLVPPLCVAAAVLLTLPSHLAFSARAPLALRRVLLSGAIVLAAFCAISSARQIRERAAHTDTRVAIVDWIRANVAPDARLLAIGELAVLPAEWSRTGRQIDIVPWLDALNVLEHERFDYIIGAEMNIAHTTEPEWRPHLERWNAHVAGLEPAVTFGEVPNPVYPYLWRTNHQRIIIWKVERAPDE